MYHPIEQEETVFCQQSEFMVFIWFSEQVQIIIYLNSINQLILAIKAQCIFCEVRSEFWIIILKNFRLQRFKC